MAHVVRHALWAAEVARSGHDDKIALERLEVVVHAGHDVWGRPKQQRAHVSVTLTLGSPFTSASSTDSVDASTVHYGTLSKAIQAALQAAIPDGGTAEHLSTAGLCSRILQCVRSVAGPRSLYATEMDVCYLKGSMFGDGAGYTTATLGSNDGQLQSKVLYLRNVRIPCILGVNPNERLQKQPVVLSIWVDGIPDTRVDDYVALETLLFEVTVGFHDERAATNPPARFCIIVPDD